MKTEIADRLADALVSGKYKQGRAALCTIHPSGDEHHCCLGVLAELAVEDGVVKSMAELKRNSMDGLKRKTYGTEEEFDSHSFGTGFPPDSVNEWAGIGADQSILFDVTDVEKVVSSSQLSSDSVRDGRVYVYAHELNDTFRLSFAEIAQLIRDRKYVTLDSEN